VLRIEAMVTSLEEKGLQDWYEANGEGTMVVYDDALRKRKLKEQVEGMWWTFSNAFLANYTGLPIKLFQSLDTLGEDSNESIKALVLSVGSMDDFIRAIVDLDGYGPYLNPYDGDEIEVSVCDRDFYIYREG
jgi:hypothetical protein